MKPELRPNANLTAYESDEIDLRQLFNHLWNQKWLIVMITAVFTLLGALYAFSALPVYQANAAIQIEKKEAGLSSLMGMDNLFMQESEVATEIEILKSRRVVGEVVDRLGLTTVVEPSRPLLAAGLIYRGYQGGLAEFILNLNTAAVRPGEGLTVGFFDVEAGYLDQPFLVRVKDDARFQLWFNKQLLAEGRVGKLIEVDGVQLIVAAIEAHPGAEFFLTKKNRLASILELQEALQISEKGKGSGILSVALEGTDPQQTEKILDVITQVYVEENVSRSSAEASKSLEFLRKQLPEVKQELAVNEEKLNQYQIDATTVNILAETQSLLEQSVAIEAKISELKLQQPEVERKFMPSHPIYQSLRSQLAELERKKNELHQKIKLLPDTQQELLRLKRDVEVGTAIYTQMLNSIQELNIVRAGTIGNVRILDEAVVGTNPVKPKKALVLALSFILGGVVSVFTVLLRAFFSRGIDSPDRVEEQGVPVYAIVPYSDEQAKIKKRWANSSKGRVSVPGGILAIQNPADIAVEAVRALRTSVHFATLEAENHSFMISSPGPNAGKSFVSANLAVVMAQAGIKTVLVDADLRKGYLHKVFGLDRPLGLSDYLAGKVEYAQALTQTEQDKLHLLSCGTIPPNPSELLMSKQFDELLQRLNSDFDIVLVDTPPILAVTDASLVAKRVGVSFLVVRHGLTQERELKAALNAFERNQVMINGVIYNSLDKKQADYAYYSYEYSSA